MAHVYARLIMAAASKAGDSVLSIQGSELGPTEFGSFAIAVSVTNRLTFEQNVPSSSFKTGVDEALNCLLESQDAQLPLPVKTSGP